jgi:hypothetical protein
LEGSKLRHIKEHEADSYAHRTLTAHGLEVPEASTYGARWYVAQCIEEDRARGYLDLSDGRSVRHE